MLDHISLAVADFERSRAFYDQILAVLGHKRVMEITDLPEYVAAGYGSCLSLTARESERT